MKTDNHIMVDLETLDNTATAVILSIGAVRFSLDNLQLGDTFYACIDPESCQRIGLTIGAQTVIWWMKQDERARQSFLRPPILDVREALLKFSSWMTNPRIDAPAIWGNGSTFDNVILRNAYMKAEILVPWSYKYDLCFRTMRRLFSVKLQESGIQHNALDDAKNQALELIEIMRRLRK